jgi:predicted nucleic acid-binding protein
MKPVMSQGDSNDFDTSPILDIIDAVVAAVEKEREFEVANVPLVISAITVLELYIGVVRGQTGRGSEGRAHTRGAPIEAVLDSSALANTNLSISRRAGRLFGECIANRR